MTEAEMIEEAKTAFIKRGFWPNDVMWACWLDAWKQSALMERESCARVCDELRAINWGPEQCATAIRTKGQK
jgi:hypothetical protein